jgi:acetylornithine deacetylase/succinyl-diaminopimelate desuccinylase-like protein
METSPAIRNLRDYIAIPSVNPMQRDDVAADQAGERRLAEHLHEQFRSLGLDSVVIGVGERRSVVAEVTCPGAHDTVLVASHIDTVPVEGMEIDPFDPRVEHGRVLGRGSCDTKAGMAACVAALDKVLRAGTLGCNLILLGEADEEYGSRGVVDVLRHLGTRRPDWVLATEPTSMRVVTSHKGIAVARIQANGRACHSSAPTEGKNALVSLSRAILSLDELASRLATREDPRLGAGTLSVNLAAGGHAPNIVPDRATLTLDRRLLPGDTVESIRQELEDALARAGTDGLEIVSCTVAKAPLGTPDEHPAVRRCQSALARIGLESATEVAAFATDAGVFAENDIPGIVLGPGSIQQAHTAREFVEIDQVECATAFFETLLRAEA